MQLTKTGAVKVGAYLARRTKDGRWLVTASGRTVGYADDLTDAEAMAIADEARRAARLAELEARAQDRGDEPDDDYTEYSMRRGEGAGIDPNHG